MAELGTRQCFSFATTTTQGQEKNSKNIKVSCLDGVATTDILQQKCKIQQLYNAGKLGHVVAAAMSRAQLWYRWYFLYSIITKAPTLSL